MTSARRGVEVREDVGDVIVGEVLGTPDLGHEIRARLQTASAFLEEVAQRVGVGPLHAVARLQEIRETRRELERDARWRRLRTGERAVQAGARSESERWQVEGEGRKGRRR